VSFAISAVTIGNFVSVSSEEIHPPTTNTKKKSRTVRSRTTQSSSSSSNWIDNSSAESFVDLLTDIY